MKKLISLLLALLMITTLTLASCNKDKNEGGDAVKVIDIPLTDEEYAFAVQKGNTELLTKLNDFLAEINENGTFNEIVNKYFGDGTPGVVTSAAEKKTDGSQLIVATNAAFPPFEEQYGSDGKTYSGIDMEIMDLFAKKLGKELFIFDMNFESVCLAVSATGGVNEETGETVAGGIADIAAAGLTVNDKRKETLDFSTSYYKASQMIIVKADDTRFDGCKTREDVEKILGEYTDSTKAGAQNGTTGLKYCEGDADSGYAGFKFKTSGYANGSLAVQDIINGNIDFVIIDEGPAKAIVKKINAAN